MLHFDAGVQLELLACELRRGSAARGGEIQLAGIRLGVGDQVLHVAYGERVVDHEKQRHADQQRDVREILDRVIGHLRNKTWQDHVDRGIHQQRVAVRRRLGHELRTDHAAGAGAIFDHHRLAERFGQAVGDDAHDDIRRAAGRVGHDDPHGPVGIVLRQRGRRERRHKNRGEHRGKHCGDQPGNPAWHFHLLELSLDALAAGIIERFQRRLRLETGGCDFYFVCARQEKPGSDRCIATHVTHAQRPAQRMAVSA